MAIRYLQTNFCSRMRLHCTADVAIGFGNLRSPIYRLFSMASARGSNSKSAEQLPDSRIKELNKRKRSTLSTNAASDESLLAKTMKQLLVAISDNREHLQCIRTWFWDLVESEEKRQMLVGCATEGFHKAGSYALLQDGAFTLDHLVKKAQAAKFAEVEGVYVRIYMHGHNGRNSSLYIGSSGNVKSRMKGHNWNLRQHNSIHARAHQRAVGKRHRVLCNLDGNMYAQRHLGIRLVVEQLLVILLRTYDTQNLLSYVAHSGDQPKKRGKTRVVANKAARTEDPDSIDAVGRTSVDDRTAEFVRDTKTSIILAKLGEEVCKQCGWNPTIKRPDSNEEFGTDAHWKFKLGHW